MRTRNSIKNIIIAITCYFVTLIVGFTARYFFVKLLGQEYLGVSSLFSNIISVMNVVELGFGTAVIYNLYRPISIGDKESIKSIIGFYKRVYRVIAGIVFALGLMILPFIGIIVGKTSVNNLYLCFFLYVVNTAVSYLLTYKRSMYFADQKNYIINIIHTILYVVLFAIQTIVLYYTRNFIYYIIIQIAFTISENAIISIKVNKSYPFLKEKTIKKIAPEIKQDIIQKVKGLLFHQIGNVIVLGTDNIIISMTKTLGIITVGLYTNYISITLYLNQVIAQIFSAVTSSVGNLLVTKDKDDSYIVYKRILFLNAILYNFVCVSIACIMEPFITLWLGTDFILPSEVLLVITLNYYVQGMKRTCGMFKEAAGVFYEDRFVPIIESIINLVCSIFFVKFFGLAGVCLGTMVSAAVHWFYDYPVYVYKLIFKKNGKQLFLDYIFYALVFGLSYIVTWELCCRLSTSSEFLKLVGNSAICIFVPNIIFILFFFRKKEYVFWRNLLKERYLKIFRK